MRQYVTLGLCALWAVAQPAAARNQDEAQERPVTDQKVGVGDVAATPVTDLNLKKDEIPPLLIAAQERPYDLAGLKRCPQLAAAVRELDLVLGDDLDLPRDGERRMSAGRVAQSVVGAFIPFRGVIREVSGANSHQRKLQAAIEAGMARRAFLKGVGESRKCAYPARPAQARDIERLEAERKMAEEQKARSEEDRKKRKDED